MNWDKSKLTTPHGEFIDVRISLAELKAWRDGEPPPKLPNQEGARKDQYEVWTNQMEAYCQNGDAGNLREAAEIIANRMGITREYVERETRRVRRQRQVKKSGRP